jgi:hypothetical protein
MNTAMPMLPNENHRKTKEPNAAVDHANTMWAKERGRNTNMAVRAHVNLPKSHSLRSIILGICWMMRDVMCDTCDTRGSSG